jgi:hypothetical protein
MELLPLGRVGRELASCLHELGEVNMRTILLLIFLAIFACIIFLWIRAERVGSMRKRILMGFLVIMISQPVTIAFSVAITQLDDQSYYAASVRIMLDEILEAIEDNDPGFMERLKEFRMSQRLTYETRANLLENVRCFRDEGTSIRRKAGSEERHKNKSTDEGTF